MVRSAGGYFRATAIAIAFLAPAVLISAAGPAVADDLNGANGLKHPLSGHAVTWTGRFAFIFGGLESDFVYSRAVYRYDPLDESITTMGSVLPAPRFGMGSAWDGRNVYIFGGTSVGLVDDILRYDPGSDTLTTMGARLPSPREHTSAAFDGTRYIYVFGGMGSLGQIVRYDPWTDSVTVMSAHLYERRMTSAVFDGQYFFLFGGYQCSDVTAFCSDIVRYDPATDSLATMNATLPTARGFVAAVFDGQVAVLLGGIDNLSPRHVLADILEYDPATDILSTRPVNLPSGLEGHRAIWEGDWIYVIGGRNQQSVSTSGILRYGRPPSVPLSLKAQPDAVNESIHLTWDPPVHTAGHLHQYFIYRSEGASSFELLNILGIGTSVSDYGCSAGTPCRYHVSALNAVELSDPSDDAVAVGLAADPAPPDSDGDGLPDSAEAAFGTDIRIVDTDGDGLSDYQEVAMYDTKPLIVDTDGDSLLDGLEVLVLGTDPNSADSDGDGAPDGADTTPRENSIGPGYTEPGSSFLEFSSDGYISVAVDAPAERESSLRSVFIEGNLSAENASGPIPWNLHFLLNAERGNGGIWGAKFAIPPGVTRVTREELRLVAYDDAGNVWMYAQTFGHVLSGPLWDETLYATAAVTDWNSVFDHMSPPNAPPGSPAPPQSLEQVSPLGNSSGQRWTYRLNPSPRDMRVLATPAGRVVLAKGAFTPIDNTEILTGPSPVANFFSSGGSFVSGFATHWLPYFGAPVMFNQDQIRETQYQSAAALLGSDHPAAHGRVAGDFVAGMLVWGNVRDCIVRPLNVVPDESNDAAIVSMGCLGLALDALMLTPAAPEAAGAEVAVDATGIAIKAAKRTAPELVPYLRDMAEICLHDLTLCRNLGRFAEYTLEHTASAPRFVNAVKGMGNDAFLRLVAKDLGSIERVDAMATDVASTFTDAEAQAIFRRISQPSRLGEADKTLEQFTDLHKLYADNPGVRAADLQNPGAPGIAATMTRDASELKDVEGFADWMDAAKSQARNDETGWTGWAFSASQMREALSEGTLVRMEFRFDRIRLNGRDAFADSDAWLRAGSTPRATEYKGSVRASNLDQLERQMAAIVDQGERVGIERALDWRISGSANVAFRNGAADLAARYEVSFRLLDASGNPVTSFVP